VTLLPWHEELAERVRRAVATNRLAHALLISGPEGWGERSFANWLALHLLGVDGDRDASTLAHPDLRWLQPEGSAIKIDAVRELDSFAHGTAQAGPRKVAVIEDAHFLNLHAANALLKTLEEPPSGTHLILTSCHQRRLIPTIRSRCQTLQFRPDPERAARWLEATVTVGELGRRLFEHGGAPVAVAEGLERGEIPLDSILAQALQSRGAAAAADALIGQGLADALGRWYRYVLSLTAGQWQVAGPDAASLEIIPPAGSARGLLEFAEELVWVRRMLVTSNSANERLLAERLVARWRHLLRQPEGRLTR
jgi:DNA polymerase III subunit delta'